MHVHIHTLAITLASLISLSVLGMLSTSPPCRSRIDSSVGSFFLSTYVM